MKQFLKYGKQALCASVCLILLCGIIYPLAVNGLSQLFFSDKANGSMIKEGDTVVGSALIGQQFTDARYFQGRVSSVNYNTYEEGSEDYAGPASGSFNYGASNPDLKERVQTDMKAFLEKHPDVEEEDVPTDLLTASGSGLDPHISVQAARIQVSAISEASGISEEDLSKIIEDNTEQKVLGIFGEEKVNVLKANVEIAKKLGEL